MDDDDNGAHPLAYFNARDSLASDVHHGIVGADPATLVTHMSERAAVDRNTAAQWVERFHADVARHTAVQTVNPAAMQAAAKPADDWTPVAQDTFGDKA